MMKESCIWLESKEFRFFGSFRQFFKLGYSRIKIDHIADSLLKLQIKIGLHLMNVELSQLLTLVTKLGND